jgi:hypothetical protein
MTSIKGLKQISPLLEALQRSEEAKLARITASEVRLRAQLDELRKTRRSLAEDRPIESDPARRAGADVLWQTWIDQRRTDINLELAQLASKKPIAVAALKLAFGRREAVRQLTKKIEREEALKRKRRDH